VVDFYHENEPGGAFLNGLAACSCLAGADVFLCRFFASTLGAFGDLLDADGSCDVELCRCRQNRRLIHFLRPLASVQGRELKGNLRGKNENPVARQQ
jgi:hypothetical protein